MVEFQKAKILPYKKAIATIVPQLLLMATPLHASLHKLPMVVGKRSAMATPRNNTFH